MSTTFWKILLFFLFSFFFFFGGDAYDIKAKISILQLEFHAVTSLCSYGSLILEVNAYRCVCTLQKKTDCVINIPAIRWLALQHIDKTLEIFDVLTLPWQFQKYLRILTTSFPGEFHFRLSLKQQIFCTTNA